MAWTGNFKTQILDLVGDLSPSDDTALQQWIKDGCYDVLSKASFKFGESEVWKFVAKSGNVTSETTDIDEIRTIAGVVRDGVFATKGEWTLKSRYSDSGSIYAATNNDPVWYIDDSNLHIYPIPSDTSGNRANYYYVPEYSLTNWDNSTSSINNYPSEYYYFVALYASIQVLHRKMFDKSIPTSPTLSTLPVAPDVPSTSAQTISISGTAPTYAKPALPGSGIPILVTVEYAGVTSSDVSVPTVSTSAYVLPSASTAFTSRLADFSALATFNCSVAPPDESDVPNITNPGIASISVSDVTTDIPTFTTRTVAEGALGALDSLSITDLDVSVVPPGAVVVKSVAYIPVNQVVIDEVADYSVDDLARIHDSSNTTITEATLKTPEFNPPAAVAELDLSATLAAMATYIDTEEDTELSSAKGQEITQRISDWQAELQNYQAKVSTAVSDHQKDLATYQEKVRQATTNANNENQIALQNMQKDLQVAQTNQQKDLKVSGDAYNTDVQKALQEAQFKQQAELQDSIQEVQAIIQDNASTIQEFTQNLSRYQAMLSEEVQEWTNNFQKDFQIWEQKNQLKLQ